MCECLPEAQKCTYATNTQRTDKKPQQSRVLWPWGIVFTVLSDTDPATFSDTSAVHANPSRHRDRFSIECVFHNSTTVRWLIKPSNLYTLRRFRISDEFISTCCRENQQSSVSQLSACTRPLLRRSVHPSFRVSFMHSFDNQLFQIV